MEIKITKLVTDSVFSELGPQRYSGSAAELGQNAGKITWNNCLSCALEIPIIEERKEYEEAMNHFADYGTWTVEEIKSWTYWEINALLIQEVASEIRQFCDEPITEWDWEQYEYLSREGQISGRLFHHENDYYITIGS